MKRPLAQVRIQPREQPPEEARRFEMALDEFIEAMVRHQVNKLRSITGDSGQTPTSQNQQESSL